MTVTLSPRLGITRWSAGTDPFTRAQLDADHDLIDDLVAIHRTGTLAARPAAAAANDGTYYLATDTGDLYRSNGSSWTKVLLAGDVTLRFAWTYSLPGEIKVPSGTTDFVPWAAIAVPSGQAVSLIGYRWYLNGGTSFTFRIRHRDAANTATTVLASGIVATSASPGVGGANFGAPQVCANNDLWHPDVTAVSGTPVNGTVSLIADVTI